MARNLTFSQRNGYEPLPEPMCLEHLSQELRVEIWDDLLSLCRSLLLYESDFMPPYKEYFVYVLGRLDKRPRDEIGSSPADILGNFKSIVMRKEFNKVFDFIELIVNGNQSVERFTNNFAQSVKYFLEEHQAAYQLDTSERPYQIVPRASKEAGEVTQEAVETVHKGGMAGASQHLRDAVTHINGKQYADSIMDSISAVESVARKIVPEAHTLGQALKPLEKSGLLKNTVLKEALQKLYGYTNDEEGIRHALIEKGAPDVGLDEALFMYGACASFAAYLTNKHKQQQADN